MKNISSAVKEYLSTQTNYAILISGKWGVGKTFYFKNTLKEEISKIDTLEDAGKKYKPIHISLFGLTSIESIKEQIALSIFPLLKNKTFKISTALLGLIADGILKFHRINSSDNFKDFISSTGKNLIEIQDLVICFDDLERKSDQLDVKDIIGYINTLVENNGAKVIIIAHDDELKDVAYKNFKEKVIGINMIFSPPFEESINAVITLRYGHSNKGFEKFITSNKGSIVPLLATNANYNLRTVIFALDKLQNIYSIIETNIPEKTNKAKSYIWQKIDVIIRFTLGVTIAFKKNEISLADKKELDKDVLGWTELDISKAIQAHVKGKEIPNEQTYRQIFISNYFSNLYDYKYFKSIFEYILSGTSIDFDIFQAEVNSKYHIEGNDVLPQYDVLNKLDWNNCYSLSEKEYKKLTSEMVKYAGQGLYMGKYFETVFYFAVRFENMLNYNYDKLRDLIIKGITKGKGNFKYETRPDIHFGGIPVCPYTEHIKAIRNKVIQINDELKREIIIQDSLGLIEKLKNNIKDFEAVLLSENSHYQFSPIFNLTKPKIVYSTLIGFDNLRLKQFGDVIHNRFKPHKTEFLIPEMSFLENLLKLLNERKGKAKTIRNHLLSVIKDELINAISNIKAKEKNAGS